MKHIRIIANTVMKNQPNSYTIKELSSIFKMSKKATTRHLRAFGIPVPTKERCKFIIKSEDIKLNNIALYFSITLTLSNHIEKPFFKIKDLIKLLNKSHSGTYRWLIRHEIPMYVIGNKFIILASTLLNYGRNQQYLSRFTADQT